jgi:hypothetical protein
VAFTVSAILFGVGAVAAALLVPSRQRLEELRNAAQAAAFPLPVSSAPAGQLAGDPSARAAE